jgi:transketolase
LIEGSDVTIVATGHLVWESISAAKDLLSQGINAEVINIHTIKPLDKDIILKSINKTNSLVSCEEHNILGGLGESISRLIVQNNKFCPMELIGVNDSFGESGTPEELMNKYKLNSENIIDKCLKVISRKKLI